jgi:hypothetical protein
LQTRTQINQGSLVVQMQIKYISALIVLMACLSQSVHTAQAQEEVGNDPEEKELKELNNHPELNLNDDKVLILDIDQSRQPTSTPQKEKEVVSTPKPKPAKSSPEEEEPLSFNFLYYIIQKFKYSDIVD